MMVRGSAIFREMLKFAIKHIWFSHQILCSIQILNRCCGGRRRTPSDGGNKLIKIVRELDTGE